MSSPSETIIPSKESRKMSHSRAKAMSMMNLPPEIILEILSRLPISTIVRCKCVCRQLLELITSAAFAELHLPRSTPGLIIQRAIDFLCKIFEFEDEVEVRNNYIHRKQLMEFNPRATIATPKTIRCMRIEGSVNGLLCLLDMTNYSNAFYICNPITREYIALPELEEALCPYGHALCGFGVSSYSGEYKMVRISQDRATSQGKSSRNFPDLKCQIYTLGTGSWRSISVGIISNFNLFSAYASYLSGSLHWLVRDAEGYSFIVCFNLETELLDSFPRIPFPFQEGYGVLGVLGDCLCVCDCYGDEDIVIWTMKDYGAGESWTKEYVISKPIGNLYRIRNNSVKPLKLYKNGDILFVCEERVILYYSTKTETASDIHWPMRNASAWIVAMLHTPSLLSLKRFEKENVASFEY